MQRKRELRGLTILAVFAFSQAVSTLSLQAVGARDFLRETYDAQIDCDGYDDFYDGIACHECECANDTRCRERSGGDAKLLTDRKDCVPRLGTLVRSRICAGLRPVSLLVPPLLLIAERA
jgi:glycine/D-amino acid oxidase-like deaminating enzyme